MVTYPCRCRIVDAAGLEVLPGVLAATPKESRPYIGQRGLAERDGWMVRITLDSGAVIYGHQCWWAPVKQEEDGNAVDA